MTRLIHRLAIALFAVGTLHCGAPDPANPADDAVSAAALSVADDGAADLEVERTVRCGDSLNSYWGTSDSASAYSQSAAKRICRQKLVNKVNKRTSCDKGACGGGSCRPSGNVRGTSYSCRQTGPEAWYCSCRPQTVVYACSSCS